LFEISSCKGVVVAGAGNGKICMKKIRFLSGIFTHTYLIAGFLVFRKVFSYLLIFFGAISYETNKSVSANPMILTE